jgi:hypothetical protein
MPISKIRSWLSCEPGIGDCTAEARRTRRKEFLIKKYSELCSSVVNTSSQETGKYPKIENGSF